MNEWMNEWMKEEFEIVRKLLNKGHKHDVILDMLFLKE